MTAVTPQALVELLTPPITLFLLVAVGLDLTVEDFRRVRERPGLIAAGVLLPPLLLPPLAVALIALVHPSPVIAAGLLLLVVCPIGGISNVYSATAGAATALSVTLTAASCAASVVTLPLATLWLQALNGGVSPYGAPARVVLTQLLVALLPPVLTGMAIRRRWPAAAADHRVKVQLVGFVLLAVLLVLVWASAAGQTSIGWASAAMVVGLFVVAAFALGAAIGSLCGGHAAERFTLAAEFATRNVAVALGVAVAAGSGRDVIWFAAVYFAVEIPLLVGAALAFRRAARDGAPHPGLVQLGGA
jgi:BASS family bile acid:Na+ symporter